MRLKNMCKYLYGFDHQRGWYCNLLLICVTQDSQRLLMNQLLRIPFWSDTVVHAVTIISMTDYVPEETHHAEFGNSQIDELRKYIDRRLSLANHDLFSPRSAQKAWPLFAKIAAVRKCLPEVTFIPTFERHKPHCLTPSAGFPAVLFSKISEANNIWNT